MAVNIPIPDRMSHLKVDPRGYAIPYGVVTDKDGTVHFAINDHYVREQSIADDLCGICGTKLFRGRWFVGGSKAAFHPQGAFIDPPMHSECAHYALQVCPYLAAPRYVREIGLSKATKASKALSDSIVLVDPNQKPERPAGELFVALMATGQKHDKESGYLIPKRPYSRVEFWKHGKKINDEDAATLYQWILNNINTED